MRNIGMIYLGHKDYLCDNTYAIQRAAYNCVNPLPFIQASIDPIATTEAEAVQAVRTLQSQDCCGALIVLNTWVECNIVMSALKELRGMPCMFWGFPLDEAEGRKESTGSYVSAAMFSGVIQRIGLSCPTLFASWNDPSAAVQIARFARVAAAMDALFYSKIGLFGYTSMSIYTGTFDHVLMRWKIGPEIQQLDTYSLIRAAEAVSPEAIALAEKRLSSVSCLRKDTDREKLAKTMGLYIAMKDFCEAYSWQAINVKCQYELSKEYKVVPCVALSLLAEDGITTSCEGDILNTVSMLLLQLLCGQQVWYGDSLTHWDNTVQFSPCGFLPLSMAQGTPVIQPFMEHPGFSGIQVCGVLRPERVTWCRLVEDIGGYHLLYGTGTGTDTTPRSGCMPALNVMLDGDINALCKEYAGQHYAIAYGDWSEELALYARLMGIEARRI